MLLLLLLLLLSLLLLLLLLIIMIIIITIVVIIVVLKGSGPGGVVPLRLLVIEQPYIIGTFRGLLVRGPLIISLDVLIEYYVAKFVYRKRLNKDI